MEQEFTPQTVEAVLGGPKQPGSGHPYWQRIPLHIDFPERPAADGFATPSRIEFGYARSSPEMFNAVGSRVDDGVNEVHLPVIDVDGGAELQEVHDSKVILMADPNRQRTDKEIPSYGPHSLLRDVLGDNGIEVEVFDYPVEQYAKMMATNYIVGQRVAALVLRSKGQGVFDVVDSTKNGHNHVFIQRPFQELDHKRLIEELGRLGIISPSWQGIVEDEGMGIVRTPWTEKSAKHISS